jgi:hypothetical protein
MEGSENRCGVVRETREAGSGLLGRERQGSTPATRQDESFSRKGGEVTETEAAAQAALRTIVVALEELRRQLEEVHSHLSPPPGEAARLVDEEGMSFSSEVRAVIECVLTDSLDLAIRDLAAAASYQQRGEAS